MEAAGRPGFGALLRQFRLDAGMTQQELAERAKVSVDAVSTLERGARTRPHRETVVLLAQALVLSPEREMLLTSAGGIGHPPRRRSEALNASPLRIVRPEPQATPRHNLPQQLTSFVGRQREVDEVRVLVSERRLVTVVGAGGVGKTRFAVHSGKGLLDDCPDGVWLVDLAPLADQMLVASAILRVLNLPSTSVPALDAVIAYLKTRHLLLILDNCEHVIAAVRDVSARIVQSCPEVRVLATSREALEVPGEQVYRLPSLLFPPNSRANAQDALCYEAVVLFVDRARAVNSSFALADDDAPDVSEICRRLDGIPLAIELAAARVKVLAPRQIAARLNQRFRLLTGGDSRALLRHQTMTALIGWSYDLLTSHEQKFFDQLSVFAGNFTLEAATAVCATDGEDDLAVVDLIESLVTKSLLVSEFAGCEQRYRLLESFRQYAADNLAARSVQEDIAHRHALFYLGVADRLERAWDETPDLVWLPLAKAELENWRSAFQWTLGKRGDVILGQHLAALRRVVLLTMGLTEGRRWIRIALEAPSERTSPALLARLELADADGAAQAGEHKVSLAAGWRALLHLREVDDALGLAHAQHFVGRSLEILGRPAEAQPLLREALGAARRFGNRRLIATALQALGNGLAHVGDFAGARRCLSEALELAMLGADFLAASLLSNFASNEYDAGNFELAVQFSVDSIAAYRRLNYATSPGMVGALDSMTGYLIVLGRFDEARATLNETLELSRQLRLAVFLTFALQNLVILNVVELGSKKGLTYAHQARSARLCGFVDATMTSLGIPRDYGLPHEYARAVSVLRDAIGIDEFADLEAAGAMMTQDEALAQAHARE